MKTFALFALIGLSAFLAVTDAAAWRECLDLTANKPCENAPDGNHPLCDICHLGYFGKCQNKEIEIIPCPLYDDGQEGSYRLVFDITAKECVKESTHCKPPVEENP